ncbi:hypothetical protein [Paenibacillus aestuarii]|uniref:SDR family NAD(P)-dependent oxidoreductase n=1 Tax=Paenibacillus aestuarii TaxID=516965 RepID=A0ABW0K2M4_9BACL|nr:hypothetical protein [Paenibacillus aestuarii]
MSKQRVWLVTGAGRGMDVDIAKAALNAGNQVVATGRSTDRQLQVALIGPMNVMRAVLPVMRKQGSGHNILISLGACISGFEFNSTLSTSMAYEN